MKLVAYMCALCRVFYCEMLYFNCFFLLALSLFPVIRCVLRINSVFKREKRSAAVFVQCVTETFVIALEKFVAAC
jgi:hypothetical protein